MCGKEYRLRRLFASNKDSRTSVMFACSHGTTTPEILSGIEDPAYVIDSVIKGGANVIFLSMGLSIKYTHLISSTNIGLALKITASASGSIIPFQEKPILSVETALKIGADAVVALVPFAPNNEEEVISWISKVGEQCFLYGLPFIAEAEYPNAYTEEQNAITNSMDVKFLKRSARLCVELGADVIKTNWPGNKESLRSIIEATAGIPVVVAGGSKITDLTLLERLSDSIEVGASGCSVGRNIFQHENPTGITKAICSVIHERQKPEEALKLI